MTLHEVHRKGKKARRATLCYKPSMLLFGHLDVKLLSIPDLSNPSALVDSFSSIPILVQSSVKQFEARDQCQDC